MLHEKTFLRDLKTCGTFPSDGCQNCRWRDPSGFFFDQKAFLMTDQFQAVRIEAARMTAQVLAGSGAEPERAAKLFWFFVAVMMPMQSHVPNEKSANVASVGERGPEVINFQRPGNDQGEAL